MVNYVDLPDVVVCFNNFFIFNSNQLDCTSVRCDCLASFSSECVQICHILSDVMPGT
jgi:hypothetical protein